MNGEAGERIKSNLDAGDRRGDRDTVLVVLLLVFAFTLIILDSSFPIPKETVVKAVFSVSYVAIFMSIIYLLVNRLMPSFLPGHNAWFTEHEHGILTVVVVMASILLAANVKMGGGIDSPYVAFLSSFPMFCIVLLFESITFLACVKGVGIAFGTLGCVYVVDPVLKCIAGREVFSNTTQLTEFMDSPGFMCLTVSVIAITIISNVLSIYFAARKYGSQN